MFLALLAGSVLLAADDVRVPEPPRTVAVTGVVFDSLAMRGLARAAVQLMTVGAQSTVRNARSDASGAFRFDDVPLGSYVLGFFHPKLDSLGWDGETLRLDLRTETPLATQLSIPSGRTVARRVCGENFATEEVGLLLGRVRGADDSRPRPGASVVLKWADAVFDSGAVKRQVSTANATANENGQFAVCGVPLTVSVLLHASVGADSSGQFEMTLPRTFVYRDVYVAPVSRARVASQDSMPDAGPLRGTGRVRGRVIGTNDRTIRGARVTVWGTGVETTTSADGEFALDELPSGTHTLAVRAIGFVPARMAIDIVAERANAQVELSAVAVTLDTVRVTAPRMLASPRLQEVERRQRSGMGQTLLYDEIDKRDPWRFTELLRTMRGVRIAPGRFGSDMVMMRDKLGNGYCAPQFIVDNIRVAVGEQFPIDVLVRIDQIIAVEVYSNIVPADFASSNNCGVVVVTTGYRPPPAKR